MKNSSVATLLYAKPIIACIILMQVFNSSAQTGYIYVHQKNINEDSSVNFSYSLKNSSGVALNTWNLNDQSTSDNGVLSNNYSYLIEIGVGHGTGGDGEMWAVGDADTATATYYSGHVYHRSPGASTWSKIAADTFAVSCIDGGYAGQFACNKLNTNNAYFYYNGTLTALPTAGLPDAITEITCNGGRIAVVANFSVYVYSASYTATSAPSTGGTWTELNSLGVADYRIDMNLAGTTLAFLNASSDTVKTVNISTGIITSLGAIGDSAAGQYSAIAWSDDNYIFATCYKKTYGTIPTVAVYNGSTWSIDYQAEFCSKLTAGAAHAVWGKTANIASSIFYRATDNTGTGYWIDDEVLKLSSTAYDNGYFIPISPGTYTVTETLPSSSWALARFNLYDPGNVSSTSVSTKTATLTVTAGEVVTAEFVNELLNPQSILTSCSNQLIQSFNTSQFGTGSYGNNFDGTAYHYLNGLGKTVYDMGYYFITKTYDFVSDHTGNGGFFYIAWATSQQDEFFRQRVTNLTAGLTYKISFYAAEPYYPGPVIYPNIAVGLQDTTGNITWSASTGNITSSSWQLFTYTFTATTSVIDLYLRNQSTAGVGNYIALDDIALNLEEPSFTVSPTASKTAVCPGGQLNLIPGVSGGTSPFTYSWTGSGTITTTTSASPTAVPTASGTYSLTVTDSYNCTATGATPTVTVNAVPAAIVLASKYLVCANPASTITVEAEITKTTKSPYTYAWSGSGVVSSFNFYTTATPIVTGTYSVTVTDANGCTSNTANSATVTVDQATPSISVNCNSNGVQLYESTGINWYWTTTSGGRFFPDNTYSISDDSSTSHLQGPFINYMGNYSVQITDANGCIGSGSTTVGACSTLLAVNLLEFTAKKETSNALLVWSTTSETNNKYFDIERSADGLNWQTIGTVQGQGTTNAVANYTYTDQLPLNGINYYRLKQVDANGLYTYSTIRSLDFSGLWLVKMYPNPAHSYVMLEFNNDKDETASIIIQNVQGPVVFTTQQQVEKGLNKINLNQVQRLAQGTYIISMGTASNVFRSKFIKEGN